VHPVAPGHLVFAASAIFDRFRVEPPRPRPIARMPRAYWLAVATVCVGAFMGQLDASIVTLALPSIRRDLGGGVGAVEWVALSYLLVLVALVAPVGRLSDVVGRKLLYVYGFGIFGGASLLCGLAPNLPLLDAARVLQGVGAAMLQANSIALIRSAAPEPQLGRAIGVQGAAQALGLALGPTLGGLLLSVADWRWLFWVNVPVAVLGVISGWLLLPRSRNLQPAQPTDWRGLLMFLPAVSAVMVALTLAEDPRRLPLAAGLVAVAAAGIYAFARNAGRTPFPLLDTVLLRRPQFSIGLLTGLLSYAVLFGVLVVTPFYLEAAGDEGPRLAGGQLTVLPVALGLTAPFASMLVARLGSRAVTSAGMVITAAGMAGLAALHAQSSLLLASLVVAGIGLGLFTPANNTAIMEAAPLDRAGSAAGILNMTRGIGTAFGVAGAGLVYALAAGAGAGGHVDATRGLTAASLLLCALAALSAAAAACSPGERAPDPRPDRRA
jgi:EmrB/QacA subfamily drug resistance transporter